MIILERDNFDALFTSLKSKGYLTIGPTVRDQAIVYDEINKTDDLPIGWTDEQGPGKYRLKKRDDQALFGYVIGPTSFKKFLYPPRTKLWSATKSENGFQVDLNEADAPQYAFLGVRSCELKAIEIQDKVFMNGAYVDPGYKARREKALIIVVNCGQAASTCFCTSMNSGPRAESGFDLSLTEVIEGSKHYFVVETGSPRGEEIIKGISSKKAGDAEKKAAQAATQNAIDQISRKLDTNGIKELLYENADHPRWDDVADRCLSCANCTMACPTCFCSTVEDVSDLSGEHAERWRQWDSCFTLEFTYLHGGHNRSSTKSRYRQWMTHKLASWQDQFETLGCVGCGRCITWCPAGIDITEEAAAIRSQKVEKAST